uniref:Uncharacterized protein n=1 Tax=Meloidogyne javanica TaxID=6303 RepID=A0A915MGZ1_MELJA
MIEYLNIEQASHKTVKQTEMKPIPLNVGKKNIKVEGEEKSEEALEEFSSKMFSEAQEEPTINIHSSELIDEEEKLSLQSTKDEVKEAKLEELVRDVRKIGEEEEEKEAKPLGEASEAIEELSRDETYEEFTLNYEPSIQITSIVVPEITKEPIHEVANVYSSGRSDEISTTTTITTEHPKIIESSPVTKIQTELEGVLFGVEKKNIEVEAIEEDKKDLKPKIKEEEEEEEKSFEHSGFCLEDKRAKITEYPKIEEAVSYETTKRQPEIKSKPLDVERKNIGYYEYLPSPSFVQEEKPEESLFETCKSTELDKSKIDQFVNIYSSGRSDEVSRTTTTKMIELPKIIEPSPIQETKIQTELEVVPFGNEKKNIEEETVKEAEEDLKPKLKEEDEEKDEKSSEHPGLCLELLFETYKSTELNKSQIDQFVNVYSSGRSDEIITSTKMEEKKIEVASISKVLETKRQLNIDSVPMEVEKKNIGYYENLPSTFYQEKKPETVESLQFI